MKTKTIFGKCLLLAMAAVLLMTLFASCSAGSQTGAIDSSWTSDDDTAVRYFSRIVPMSAEAHEKFVAASRGYNMSAEGFDDSKVEVGKVKEEATDEEILTAAKAALELVKPTDDASKIKFDEFCNALTVQDVHEIVARMQEKVDLTGASFPGIILVWIGKFLQVLTKITGSNYVWALFIFALIVEVLMLPFSFKQQKNSQKQAKMRPKEMAIRKKYAGRNDQKSMQAMQQEIQKLYQEEGFNPMGGCLPLLIQMPIVIVLYNIVVDPIRYVFGKAQGLSQALTTYCTTSRAAGGLGESLTGSRGTIELVSKLTAENKAGFGNFAFYSNSAECAAQLEGVSDLNFSFLGLDTGAIPQISKPSLLWLIPVLTFVVYFFSMKLNRKFSYQPAMANDQQVGCSNNMMDITMPLMSVYITFIVPAALGIYWIFKSILGTVKQFIIHKTMPLPECTEEDIKAAERELKGKSKPLPKAVTAPAATRTTKDGRTIRSLHYIDEEDDLPPRQPETVRDDEPEQEEQSGAAQSALKAPLKEDRKNDSDKK